MKADQIGAPVYHSPHEHRAPAQISDAQQEAGVHDPVCGMTVDPHATAHRHQHAGRTYYFCSAVCRGKFAAAPDKYIGSSPEQGAQPASGAEGTIYTCPMHPQIRQPGPGSCPICGMALEPELAAPSGGSPELNEMSRRFWISLALAVPV